MASTRVHILAKELGVKSTAIVKKCQDEGLDVKGHMSTLSAGLAATIKEWFSEGEHTTTVETTEKVDLKKVRIRKKTKKKPIKTVSKKQDVESTSETQLQDQLVETAEPIEQKEPEKQPEVEPEPEEIKPAGPMLIKPKPAKLSGPVIVRVEEPEPERQRPTRRPRVTTRVPRVRTTAPVEQLIPKDHDLSTVKKTEGQKAKKRGKKTTPVETDQHKDKRRQKDIEERRARINAADGIGLRMRPRRKIDTDSKSKFEPAFVSRPEKATISEPIIVKDLSSVLTVKTSDVIYKLMQQGVMATANQSIAPDVAELVALEFGTELTVERKRLLEDLIREDFENRPKDNLKRRSVIVTMLGHVDHGKTSLLDKIRSSKVADGEAGGITQHVSTYQVTKGDAKVTFIDTPGHAAFTAMRARGANMTDVVVLVVAADDGVMPQTVEVINHAKAANVPVIVALNKIDIPGCDVNRIYSQLSEHDLTPAEWSGNTEIVKTSAVTGQGIDDLLEHLDYIAELSDLKADDTIPATGWVVEAKLSSKRGVVATLLVKEGFFKKGDIILAGGSYGRVKAVRNSFGKNIRKAVSSMPVEITGLNEVPSSGERFYCLDDINKAKNAAEEHKVRSRETSLSKRTQITLDNLFSQIEAGSVKELNIIIRADVQGSVDVLVKYLTDLSTDEVKVKVIHAAPGGITEGDVVLAEASNAIVIGFNVVPEDQVAKIADTKGVEIRLYTIIYQITDDLKNSMAGLLEPEEKEQIIGKAVVRESFKVSKIGTIAGCYVTEGIVSNKAKVRLIRNNVVVRDAMKIGTLKHFKDEVKQVRAGLECGIKLEKFDDIKVDDEFVFFEIVKIKRTL